MIISQHAVVIRPLRCSSNSSSATSSGLILCALIACSIVLAIISSSVFPLITASQLKPAFRHASAFTAKDIPLCLLRATNLELLI
jgi:hypothetical protein